MKIYYMDIKEMESFDWEKKMEEVLSEERISKIKKIHHFEDKKRSAAAGFLLEYGLVQFGLKQRKLKFSYAENGKAFLESPQNINFNLSHSKEFAAAIFSEEEVGIDLEEIKPGKEKIAAHFFTREEQDYLAERTKPEEFIRLWTRKESYMKATGLGMKQSLREFSVLEQTVKVREELETEQQESWRREDYFFESYFIPEGYMMSVCQKNTQPKGQPQRLSFQTILEKTGNYREEKNV